MQVVRAEGRVARREVDLHLLGVAAAAWDWSVRAVVRCVRVRFASESSGAQASSVRDWGRAEMAARGEHVLCGYNVRFWALISSAVAAKANSCGVMHRALAACKILAFSLEILNERAGGGPCGLMAW